MARNPPLERCCSAGRLLLLMTEDRSLNSSLKRNIDVLRERRQAEEAGAALDERIAAAVTNFAGSMRFVYVHAAAFGFWAVANLGLAPGVKPWDPSFVILATVASVEAIFLSTFILITQNRMSAAAARRAELDVQIGLLAEAEITKLVELVSAIAERMDVSLDEHAEIEEMKQRVAPEAVLDAIEKTNVTA